MKSLLITPFNRTPRDTQPIPRLYWQNQIFDGMPDEEVINVDEAVVAELAGFEGSIRTFCCGLDFVKRRFVLPFFQFEGEFIACECELRAVPHLRLVFHHPGLDLRPAALPFVEMIISAALPPVAQVELLAILKAEDNRTNKPRQT